MLFSRAVRRVRVADQWQSASIAGRHESAPDYRARLRRRIICTVPGPWASSVHIVVVVTAAATETSVVKYSSPRGWFPGLLARGDLMVVICASSRGSEAAGTTCAQKLRGVAGRHASAYERREPLLLAGGHPSAAHLFGRCSTVGRWRRLYSAFIALIATRDVLHDCPRRGRSGRLTSADIRHLQYRTLRPRVDRQADLADLEWWGLTPSAPPAMQTARA